MTPTPAPPHPAVSSEITPHLRSEREVLHHYVTRLMAPDLRHVEDIVQETLLRAWLRAEQLDWRETSIRPWLFRTARNLAIDTWRKDRTVPVGNAWNMLRDSAHGADHADRVVDRHWLMHALQRLPPIQHEVLFYVHMLGLSGAETADALRIPRGTVKSRTHHAMCSLRRELNGPGYDSGQVAA